MLPDSGGRAILGRSMRFSGTARFGLLAGSAYVALAWAFRFPTAHGDHNASLFYPLDTFSMYAEEAPPRVGAVVVRLADGTFEPVDAFATLECVRSGTSEPLVSPTGALAPSACDDAAVRIEYLEGDLAAYLAAHRGAGSLDVELVRRTWSTDGSEPPRDCVFATCRAAR